MKVILAQPFAREAGHASTETWNVAQAIAQQGDEVTVVSFDGFIEANGRNSHPQIETLEALGHCPRVIRASISRLFRFFGALQKITRSHPFVWWSTRGFRRIIETYFTMSIARRHLRRVRGDAILCLDGEPLGFLLFAAIFNDCRLILKLLDPLLGNSRHPLFRLKWHLENWLCAAAVGRNGPQLAFTTITPKLLELYNRRRGFTGHCSYVPPFGVRQEPNLIDRKTARRTLNLPTEGFIALVFGVNHQWKDYQTVLRAFSQLRESIAANVYLLFAGKISSASGHDPRELRDRYACENVIIVDDFIPGKYVPYYFSAADVLLLSYKKNTNLSSSILMEAIRYDTPVLTSDVEPTASIVRKYQLGEIFEPENEVSLRMKLETFISLPEDAISKMRERLRTCSTQFSWSAIARSYLDLLNQLSYKKKSDPAGRRGTPTG